MNRFMRVDRMRNQFFNRMYFDSGQTKYDFIMLINTRYFTLYRWRHTLFNSSNGTLQGSMKEYHIPIQNVIES